METERFKPNFDNLADNLVSKPYKPSDIDILNLEKEPESILDESFGQEPTAPPEEKPKTEKQRSKKEKTENIEVCVHHWKIESPVDGISHGACKNCNVEKDFDYDKAFRRTWYNISNKKYENAQIIRDEKGRFLL